MNFNPENPCQGLDIKNRRDVQKFFALETTFMPPYGYAHKADNALKRFNACALIKQFGYLGKCHPVVPFLAISYYDNFISTHDIPVIIAGDPFENLGVFVISCFFTAWKMIYPDECDVTAFLIKLDSCFATNDLDAMEHKIDRWLENCYCKRPITSLTFLDFFISDLADVHETHVALIKNFATHRAYAQQYNIEYTEYKPSILAATAILYSCGIFYKNDYDFFAVSIFESYYLDSTSLRQALGVQKPQGVVKPATLKKIRNFLGDLPSDFTSSSSSSDHRPAPHDNKPINNTSSTYPELEPPFDDDDDEPFNDRSTLVLPHISLFYDVESGDKNSSSRRPQFHDNGLIDGTSSNLVYNPFFDDYEPIGKSSSPGSSLFHDNEPIGDAPRSSSRTQQFPNDEPTDDASRLLPHLPLFHDIEPIDDVASSFSCTRPPRDAEPTDAVPSSLPQGTLFHDNEPIDHTESSSSTCLPLRHDYKPTDAALRSSTCDPLCHDWEMIQEPTAINLDFLDWSPEDVGPIHNVLQGVEKMSIEAGTSSSTPHPTTPHPRFTESDSTINPIASVDQAVAAAAEYRSKFDIITNHFANIPRPKKRRSSF